VIAEFFPKGKNKHADEVIKQYYIFLDKQKANGRKGGRPKNHVVKEQEKPTGNPLDSQNNPVPSQPLPTTHLPLTKEDQILLSPPAEKPPKVDQIPYEKIVTLYHEKLPTLPKVAMLTAKRKGYISARWRSGNLPDLDTWGKYFDFVAKSEFLMGMSDPTPGHKQFRADLEWLSNESNYTKILERKYHGTR